MTLFAFVYVQAYYHISLKRMQVAWPLCAAVAAQVLLLARYHDTVQRVLFNLILVMAALLLCVSFFTWRLLWGSRLPDGAGIRVGARVREMEGP